MGFVSNANNPTIPGDGINNRWSNSGFIGIDAGHQMCQAIGADHVCSYQELVDAETSGAFLQLPDMTRSTAPIGGDHIGGMWVHRLTEVTFPDPNEPSSSITSQPGPGGRCNDWTLAGPAPYFHEGLGQWITGDTALGDGEYAELIDGSLKFYFDKETSYTGVSDTTFTNPDTDPSQLTPYDSNFAPWCETTSNKRSIACCNMP